jgi:hypothetical protein
MELLLFLTWSTAGISVPATSFFSNSDKPSTVKRPPALNVQLSTNDMLAPGRADGGYRAFARRRARRFGFGGPHLPFCNTSPSLIWMRVGNTTHRSTSGLARQHGRNDMAGFLRLVSPL